MDTITPTLDEATRMLRDKMPEFKGTAIAALNNEFMQRFTNINSFESFLELGGYNVSSYDELRLINKNDIDLVVGAYTHFKSFDQMVWLAVNVMISPDHFNGIMRL